LITFDEHVAVLIRVPSRHRAVHEAAHAVAGTTSSPRLTIVVTAAPAATSTGPRELRRA